MESSIQSSQYIALSDEFWILIAPESDFPYTDTPGTQVQSSLTGWIPGFLLRREVLVRILVHYYVSIDSVHMYYRYT